MLARLTHELLDPAQGIDLLNVAFENPRVAAQLEKQANGTPVDPYEACPDRITGRKSFAELLGVCTGRRFRFVAVCCTISWPQRFAYMTTGKRALLRDLGSPGPGHFLDTSP